jgi:RNA polymerase sigma-70 factor (ECF subfamily)
VPARADESDEALSDEALMLRVGRGDAAACRTLVERHLPRMVAFARRLLGNQSDAEDVAQEVFLRLWSRAADWRPEAKLSTWMHRVALNLCRDRMRRVAPPPLEEAPEPADPAPSATDGVRRAELAERVERALTGLPERQRAALALCHYQGLSNTEAAEVLGVRVAALESLLSRGRRALRTALAAEAPDLLGGEP